MAGDLIKQTDEERHLQDQYHNMVHVAAYLEQVNFAAYADLLHRPWRLAWTNALGGVFRGLGIGIGFTIVAGVCLLTLQQLELLNLPVIGKFIADLVAIVQGQLHTHQYTY